MPQNSQPVLRFAPSPTGFLHIGGARTALFNWLYARHTGGKLLLRIEDTDRQRSTPEAIDAILDGMTWLGLLWDGEPIYQFARAARHREVAETLLGKGLAYRCFASPTELEEMRARQRAEGKPMRYDGRWRDRDPSEASAGTPFVIRLKAPQIGETTVHDVVQGDVRFANENLDDMVLLRSDGTPTYMLAVVVDDFDMGITHIIRGDDHLNNAARQLQLIQALDWPVPIYGHLPLIHGPDGAKLSKRHGALAVDAYREMGYLPEAMRNYLLRLGWSHGNDEIITPEQAIAWFDLGNLGRSAARFDFKKLDSLNAHYIRATKNETLLAEVTALLHRQQPPVALSDVARARLLALMPSLKERAKTLVELAEAADFLYADGPRVLDSQAERVIAENGGHILAELGPTFQNSDWRADVLESVARSYADGHNLKLGKVAQPIRAAITGRTTSPPIFDVMAALGREEAMARMDAYAG
ncbi:MAG: glutamate--tRNA ligase [Alphaproteobacteria bacterium]